MHVSFDSFLFFEVLSFEMSNIINTGKKEGGLLETLIKPKEIVLESCLFLMGPEVTRTRDRVLATPFIIMITLIHKHSLIVAELAHF